MTAEDKALAHINNRSHQKVTVRILINAHMISSNQTIQKFENHVVMYPFLVRTKFSIKRNGE